MSYFSRRKFSALASGGAVIAPSVFAQRPGGTVTAADIVDRIRGKVGVEWKSDTVDTFKAGDPAAVVKGIAITSMATIDVLKQAVATGANMVITAEPTFFAKADNPNPPPGRGQGNATGGANDAVLAAKKDFIDKNGLVVWRFSDHWRLRKPDPLAQGLTDAMGWSTYQVAGDATHFELPPVTLDALAGDLKKKLGIRGGMRVVGNPKSEIRKVGLLTGTAALAASLRMMPAVDAIVAGEVREWESVEYAHDTVAAGMKKGMILLGRVISEEPGMKLCATWLHGIVSEVPVKWIPAGDPYWRPV